MLSLCSHHATLSQIQQVLGLEDSGQWCMQAASQQVHFITSSIGQLLCVSEITVFLCLPSPALVDVHTLYLQVSPGPPKLHAEHILQCCTCRCTACISAGVVDVFILQPNKHAEWQLPYTFPAAPNDQACAWMRRDLLDLKGERPLVEKASVRGALESLQLQFSVVVLNTEI